MRRSSLVCCFLLLLMFTCAAYGQAPEKLLVVASSAAEPEAAVPEAPVAHLQVRPATTALIRPAIRPLARPNHGFFDRTNNWLHAGVFAAVTADFITTRQAMQVGAVEANPLARPLVQRGLAGQMAAAYGLGEGSIVLASYLFHRTGHHRLERLVPASAIVVEGLVAASNVRTRNSLTR